LKDHLKARVKAVVESVFSKRFDRAVQAKMLLMKFVPVAGLVLVYGLLLMMFFSMERRSLNESPCPEFDTCIRCCSSEEKCNKESVRKLFNNSGYFEFVQSGTSEEDVESQGFEFHIIYGKPYCSMFKGMSGNLSRKWDFFFHGNVQVNRENGYDYNLYQHDQYCIEEVEDEEEKMRFNLLTCEELDWDLDIIKYFCNY
jgi:predicted secreted protein